MVSRTRLAPAAVTAIALAAVGVTPSAYSYTRPGLTERISIGNDGSEGNGPITGTAAVSADGRFIAFGSDATNLVPGDTNGHDDIFVRDRLLGTTERVSVAGDGSQANGPSHDPQITPDGRFVAFWGPANNLVPNDTNQRTDVFVHDRVTKTTRVASAASDGSVGNNSSILILGMNAISGDGRYVAFPSLASNLVPGTPMIANGNHMYVHDMLTGENDLVSVADNGPPATQTSQTPSMSADGRYVAFETRSALVPQDTNGIMDVYVRDRVGERTELVSASLSGGAGNDTSWRARLSADGRYASFDSSASNLVPRDAGLTPDVFVRDLAADVTERVSVNSHGEVANEWSFRTAISADGRFVAFWSSAPNLDPDKTMVRADAFVRDRLLGTTERVSIASDGTEGNNTSQLPSISRDATFVAWNSLATNLVPDDNNNVYDTYGRTRGPGIGPILAPAVTRSGSTLQVTGLARIAGEVVGSASDPAGDVVLGDQGRQLVGDLSGASLAYRPEEDDELLFRLHFFEMAAPFSVPGMPATVYGVRFEVSGVSYELRVTGGELITEPTFELYRCEPVCLGQEIVRGSFGTTGREIQFALPLTSAGATEGSDITELRAFAALGNNQTGATQVLDEVAFPGAALSITRVSLGIAPAGTALEAVDFTESATLTQGQFELSIDVALLPAGDYELWARVCLGEQCGAKATPITIGNRAPDAVDDSATTRVRIPVTINVLANDSDPDGDSLTVTMFTDPLGGSAVNNGDGTVTYRSDCGFSGTDTFSYTISDGNGGTDTALVSVRVRKTSRQGSISC
jgi:hypothetical protein